MPFSLIYYTKRTKVPRHRVIASSRQVALSALTAGCVQAAAAAGLAATARSAIGERPERLITQAVI